jgi:hypothetical protein
VNLFFLLSAILGCSSFCGDIVGVCIACLNGVTGTGLTGTVLTTVWVCLNGISVWISCLISFSVYFFSNLWVSLDFLICSVTKYLLLFDLGSAGISSIFLPKKNSYQLRGFSSSGISIYFKNLEEY